MRKVIWFSCGAASAVTAKRAKEKYGEITVAYCDTMVSEHPDNRRFFSDVQEWIGQKIIVIGSTDYKDVDDVFKRTRFMSSPKGARCTAEMKKIPRFEFQRPDDIHFFGFTWEEASRIKGFEADNHDIQVEWILRDQAIDKKECYHIIKEAGIELPAMYQLGYTNNNCLGCVKATSPGYWNKIRQDFPGVFKRRAEQSRELGVRLARVKDVRVFLDELPEDATGDFKENISCGPDCGLERQTKFDF